MSEREELLILVNDDDSETGVASKSEVHAKGLQHRAISVCLVDENGRMLLQRRALKKYHSGGLWTNACCTHPRPQETTQAAASRRLEEELGISCKLEWILRTHYRADVSGGLIENEVVHLFVGSFSGDISPNPDEVESIDWITAPELRRQIASQPEKYTYWFRHYLRHFATEMFSGIAA